MATPKHKLPCYRNDDYRGWLTEQSCALCEATPYDGCEPAHVRIGNGGGMGLKPSDYRAVPLCHSCHNLQHRVGERTFWGERDTDLIMIGLMYGYMKDKRAAVEAMENLVEAER